METYNKHLAKSTRVALIHVSYDEKDEEALTWAKKENFPWLTITPSNRKASQLTRFSHSDYVPEYQLYDATGKAITEEGKAAIAKAIELAK